MSSLPSWSTSPNVGIGVSILAVAIGLLLDTPGLVIGLAIALASTYVMNQRLTNRTNRPLSLVSAVSVMILAYLLTSAILF